MTISEYLKKARLVTDGAMGTYYSKLENSGDIHEIAEYANLYHKEKIKQIHIDYIKAGAVLLRTNTFAANRTILSISKDEQTMIYHNACQIAREAILDSEEEHQVFIAGDIGPIPELIATEEEEIYQEYLDMIDIFLEEKVDAILFETFPDLRYIKDLTAYIKKKSPKTFVMVEFCLNKNGYTRTGASDVKLLEQVSTVAEIDAVGFNCGIGSGHMYQVLSKLKLPRNKYIMAAPNAGYPEHYQNRMVFMDNALYFAENCKKIADLGTAIVGACCGTTPNHIKAISSYVKELPAVICEEVNKSEFAENATKERDAIDNNPTEHTNHYANNSFYQMLQSGKKVIAVELDPPFDADDKKVIQCAQYLREHNVDMITMADSPMGRSRIDSVMMSIKIKQVTGMDVMPHVCCRDKNMIAMRSSLLGAYINDIRNILIVTGDPVPDGGRLKTTGVFDYNSIRLMEFVNEMNAEHFEQEPFVFGGAMDPGVKNVDKLIERTKKKIAAGAQFFLTQPIYSDETIDKIAYIKRKLDTKILCGIMPFVSFTNATFIKNEFTGIHVPEEIVNRYHKEMSRQEAEMVGADIANEIIEKLNPYADGYYFMLPFNRVSFMDKIKI